MLWGTVLDVEACSRVMLCATDGGHPSACDTSMRGIVLFPQAQLPPLAGDALDVGSLQARWLPLRFSIPRVRKVCT